MKDNTKLSEILDRIYFKKYDDQMGGLDEEEERELEKINHFIDTRPDNNILTEDNALEYVKDNLSNELFDFVVENMYDEIRDVVFEQEASNRCE